MSELPILTIIALVIFGLGGSIALSVVPWACIGTGLIDKDKENRYESY